MKFLKQLTIIIAVYFADGAEGAMNGLSIAASGLMTVAAAQIFALIR